MDPVNAAGSGPGFHLPTGDKIVDAGGIYVMPGLVEMHAHLPRPGAQYGPRSLDYAFRLYLGHGITTVRDAGSDAGIDILLAASRTSGYWPGLLLILMQSAPIAWNFRTIARAFSGVFPSSQCRSGWGQRRQSTMRGPGVWLASTRLRAASRMSIPASLPASRTVVMPWPR